MQHIVKRLFILYLYLIKEYRKIFSFNVFTLMQFYINSTP